MEAKKKDESLLSYLRSKVTGSLDSFFYFWGYHIGCRPWTFISGCFFVVFFCSMGLFNFHRESRPDYLWIPSNSRFYNTSRWLMEHFPSPIRQQFVILTADNVLEPRIIKELLRVHQKVKNISVENKVWSDICFRLPVVKVGFATGLKGFSQISLRRFRRSINESDTDFFNNAFDDFDTNIKYTTTKRTESVKISTAENSIIPSTQNYHQSGTGNEETVSTRLHAVLHHTSPVTPTEAVHDLSSAIDNVDFSVVMPRQLYCPIVETLPRECWEFSLLELWNFDEEIVNNLTKQDILNDVNNIRVSPVFGTPADYTPLLGDTTHNSTGHIVSAKSVLTIWHNEVNLSAIDTMSYFLDAGLGDPADKITLEWELALKELILNMDIDNDINSVVRVWRSFGDESTSSIFGEIHIIFYCHFLVYCYIFVMMSDVGAISSRVISLFFGASCVILSSIVCVGVCSALGVTFGPFHNILPLLLLALGIDDMFIIVQCWDNLSAKNKQKPLPERMGLTLEDAGVSITITSLTDMTAFAVGASTVLPVLRSFCIYTSVGIFAIFWFQATFFVAWFVLDQRRMENNRNNLFWFVTHSRNWGDYKWLNPRALYFWIFRHWFVRYLFKTPCKILALLCTALLFSISVWRMTNLKQEFDPLWLLQKSSYLYKYGEVYFSNFTVHGEDAFVFLVDTNYSSDMKLIDYLVQDLRNQDDIIVQVADWYTPFKEYVNQHFDEDVPNRPIPEKKFRNYLSLFLFSPNGALHQKSFKFQGKLICAEPTPEIELSFLHFRYRVFTSTAQHVPAMQRIRRIVERRQEEKPGSWYFPWAYMYILWENDEIIFSEVYRNIGLVSLCVFGSTFVVLGCVKSTLLVLLCVTVTLVDVMGFMEIWELTINLGSCTQLMLAIGLCVDYAAHISHSFLTFSGNRQERAIQTLSSVGPAVFNGGSSTFLAFVMLAISESYILVASFRLFVLVISFGMFHGLIFLPVLLSYFGPPPNKKSRDRHDNKKNNKPYQMDALENITVAINGKSELSPFIVPTTDTTTDREKLSNDLR